LSQPPMDIMRVIYSDMPAIDTAQSDRLMQIGLESMLLPIERALRSGQRRGEIEHHDLGLIAGAILGMVQSLYCVPDQALERPRPEMAREVIDVLLKGLRSSASAS
jgi:hypothetical protein